MNAIFYLILSILSSSVVALTMKVADHLEIEPGPFIAVNYLVCTVTVLAWGGWESLGSNSILIWGLSVFIGAMYVLSLWLFNRAIAAEGLALSTTLMRLSAAIPTLGSLILFAEQATFYQIIGIVVAFLSLPLASKEPLRVGTSGQQQYAGLLWGLLLFAVYGITDFSFKIQVELEPLADPKGFMTGIFAVALLLTLPRLTRKGLPKPCLTWGLVLGTANMLATYFWIRTLSDLPGSIAYPTLGLGVIIVTTVVSLTFWKEKLRLANYFFLALSSLAIFLINIG
jgi:drug/metabolite transporter (DMT)-like permease